MITEKIVEIITAARRLGCNTVVIDEHGRIRLGFPGEEAKMEVVGPMEPTEPVVIPQVKPYEPDKPIIGSGVMAYAAPGIYPDHTGWPKEHPLINYTASVGSEDDIEDK